ncbi:MAG TPA: hypothetical protein VGB71_07065 [Flavisolibacter sp.]
MTGRSVNYGLSFIKASLLRLAGWDGAQWIGLSGRATAIGNGEDTCVTGTIIPGIQALAIGKICQRLK